MEQYCGVFICIAFFPGSSKFMETFDQETNFWTDVSKHPISILFRNYFFCRLAGSLVFALFVATQVSIIHPFRHKLIIVAITTSNCRPLTGRWQVSEAFYFMRHCPGEHCCCAWCEPHVPRPWPGTPWGAVREGEAVTVQSPQVRIQIRWRLTAEVPGRGSREELGWCRGFMLIQQQSVLHFKGGDHGNQKKIHFALFFAKKMCKKCVFFEKFENCAKMWESSKKKFVFPLIGLKTSFRWGGCNFYQFDYLTKKFPIHCFSGTSCGSVIKEKLAKWSPRKQKSQYQKKYSWKASECSHLTNRWWWGMPSMDISGSLSGEDAVGQEQDGLGRGLISIPLLELVRCGHGLGDDAVVEIKQHAGVHTVGRQSGLRSKMCACGGVLAEWVKGCNWARIWVFLRFPPILSPI